MSKFLRSVALALGVLPLMLTAAFAENVHEYKLDNGLLVLLKENHNAPVINLNVVYRVGSKYEHPGITGISHLIEHMMFKTSKNLPLGEFDRRLKAVGADNNAYTWLDQTVYHETIAADQIDVALGLEAERMVNLSMLPADHQFEMTVVRNELEQRDDTPFTLLYERLISNAFTVHPYRFPTIGWKEDVENITTEQLSDYYHRYYHPDNAFIVAVGDFDPDEMFAKIKAHFDSIPAAGVELPKLPVEPPQTAERRFEIKRAGQLDYLLVAWHVPESENPDSYALTVLGQLLGQGRTSRLYRALVDSGKCASAQAWAANFSYADPFLFFAMAVMNPGVDPADVEPVIYSEIQRIVDEGVSDQELARAKKQARVSFVYDKDSIEAEAQSIVYFELMSSYKDLDKYLPGIEAVTNDDVKRVAAKYLTATNRTVGTYLAQQPQPQAPGAGQSAQPVAPPHYRPADPDPDTPAALSKLAGSPAPRAAPIAQAGAVDTATAAPAAETAYATATTLPNGLTVVVKENHNNPTVTVNGLVRAGRIDDPPDLPGLGNFTVSMLSNGTTEHSKLELAEIIEDAGLELGFSPSREYFNFSGRSLTEDFGLLLDLLAEQLLKPAFPDEEIEKTRQQILAGLLDSQNDTFDQAFYTGRELIYGGDHPFAGRVEGRPEAVKRIGQDDLKAWYAAHVLPDGAVLTIVGDVDADSALAEVARRFGAWSGGDEGRAQLLARGAEFSSAQAGQRQDMPIPEKSNVSLVWMGPGASKLGAKQWAAQLVTSFILGGDMSSRLNNRLRLQEGLTYGAFSWFSNGRAAGPFCVAVQVNPDNVAPAISATQEVLADYAAQGATADELQLAKSYLTGNFPVKLSNNGAVAGVLTESVYLGKGVDYVGDYPDLIRAVSLDDVNADAAQVANPDGMLLVAAGTLNGDSPREQ